METFWLVLGYTGRVVSNILQILVILYLFAHLGSGFQKVIVAILGLIYVTIRTIAIGNVHLLSFIAGAVSKEFLQVYRLLGEDISERTTAMRETDEKMQTVINKLYIDGSFLSLVSLICLYQLYTNLS
jgi:hypothetical protein